MNVGMSTYAGSAYRADTYATSSVGGSSRRPQSITIPPFDGPHVPSDADLAAQALADESAFRFPAFSTNDAVTLGLSLRKRFRSSSRHQKQGRSMVLAIQTGAGVPLFACAVGEGASAEDWAVLEGACAVVRRTGHSSYYVEKGAVASIPGRSGVPGEKEQKIHGGAFPIVLENALFSPIAIVGCYSGSSDEDHRMVVTTVRDYIHKMHQDAAPPMSEGGRMTPGRERDSSTIYAGSEPDREYMNSEAGAGYGRSTLSTEVR